MKLFLLTLLISFLLQDGARQANRDYEAGNYASAERGYLEALENDPDNARLLFNLGNALARQGKTEEAARAFEQFKEIETNPAERAKADYNLGNMFSDQEQWDHALQRFRESILANPDDEDARFNYELAYRNEQEQEQDQQQDQQEQDEGDGESEPQQSNDDQQQEGDRDQEQQQQPSEGEQQQQQQQQHQEPGSMTPEQADDILKALDNIEKDLLKDFQKNQVEPAGPHEKDW